MKAWVCVSEEFLVLRVTKLILEGIGSATPSDIQSNNLDFLQLKLKESLGDKRFLLVLDDVWDEGCTEWDQLRTPLAAAGQGSKVVLTTRSEGVEQPCVQLGLILLENYPQKIVGPYLQNFHLKMETAVHIHTSN